MYTDSKVSSPSLVSVIVPCYNQGHYLAEAINSVLTQNYAPVEIVVVDDGSTDNTKAIAAAYPSVKYIHQQNRGLSAARNTGIDNSTGAFLVFLDSDDWLLPGALATNVGYLQQHPEAVFVSGSHQKVSSKGIIPEVRKPIALHPYHQLLHQNYIGMIAAVMFRRWIFDHYRYDTSLHSCEDYDLYLKITRNHPVVHHTQQIAAYRIHENSMSKNLTLMLDDVSTVLKRQEYAVKNKQERDYVQAGLYNWKKFYCRKFYIEASRSLAQNKRIEEKEFRIFSGDSSLYLLYLNASLRVKYFYSKMKWR